MQAKKKIAISYIYVQHCDMSYYFQPWSLIDIEKLSENSSVGWCEWDILQRTKCLQYTKHILRF